MPTSVVSQQKLHSTPNPVSIDCACFNVRVANVQNWVQFFRNRLNNSGLKGECNQTEMEYHYDLKI
jgi:hypothetical protein